MKKKMILIIIAMIIFKWWLDNEKTVTKSILKPDSESLFESKSDTNLYQKIFEYENINKEDYKNINNQIIKEIPTNNNNSSEKKSL